MCGRTALTATPEELRTALGLQSWPELSPRYNITPSQVVAVVRVPGTLELLPWGLIPAWAPDRKIAHKLALARVESVLVARPFREAVRRRRCLVVVSAFYEWQRAGTRQSTPFAIARPDRKPFALAGVWERWVSKDGEVVDSCAVLTQAARPPIDRVHDRMPLVLGRDAWPSWLDPATEDVVRLLEPQTPELAATAVSLHVNDPRHDDPTCLVAAEPAQGWLFASS